MKALFRHLFTRKRLYELLIVLGAVGVVSLIAVSITPSAPSSGGITYFQTQNDNYYRAKVTEINKATITATLLDGPLKGQDRTLPYSSFTTSSNIGTGTVVLVREGNEGTLSMYGKWYIPFLIILGTLFIAIVALVGRSRGIMSIWGLIASIAIIGIYIIPQLLNGSNAFLIITSGAFFIAVASIYIAHGRSRRTTISVIAICIVLLIVSCLSYLVVWIGALNGITSEVSASLAISGAKLDMQGVLAGSIIIATLGVLDDVVTTQVATIDKLHSNKPSMTTYELYTHGMDVGREHIAALVNTLALAYIGVSLPLVLLFASGQAYGSFILFANGEFITQEIVRTLLSSMGLVIAVPISTILAAWLLKSASSSISRQRA